MFGSSNPFGQSSSSPFGSQSVFGQTSSTNNNPFAPKPFGSTTPFGAQTGSNMFGGTSTGVFGGATQASSSFPSSTTFGAASSPAFGNTTPAFGATSSSSPSPFGGSSGFGQKPVFGAFGSNPAQASPFGTTTQPSQPAFGSSIFGSSTPFGGSSQPAFGATTTPAFGATSTPAFGATSTPAFGATNGPAFGATTTPSFGATSTPAFGATSSPAFGSTTSPTFGSTGAAFGVSSSPLFGSGGAFGASSAPAFGSSSSTFGTSSNPAFGASSAPGFGSSSTPSFSFPSTPAFGQSSSTFGSSQFAASSPFGAQSSPFGAQSTTFGNTSAFGQSAFGGQQRGGSRVVAYAATPEPDGGTGTSAAGKLESISAMPQYKEKSHEELRWEDYQLGDKGGPAPAGGSGFGITTSQPNPLNSAPTFPQASSPFNATTSSNLFAPKTSSFTNTGFTTTSTPFSSSSFGISTSTSPFAPSQPSTVFPQTSSPSLFSSSSSAFSFSAPAATTTSTFNSNPFNPTPPAAQTGGAFTSPFGQNTTPFAQPFSNPSTGFGLGIPSAAGATSSQMGFSQPTPTSFSMPFSSQPTQNSGFNFNSFNQTQPGNTSGLGGGSTGILGQNNYGQLPATQSSAAVQPVPATNPFGTLPAMPQMSISRGGTAPSIQYGISSMPVVDKPAPVKVSYLLTSQHLSQRRVRLPARKYNPKNDDPRFPFFIDDEEIDSTPKADALFLPRENPRALVIRPKEQWPQRVGAEKASPLKDTSTPVHENETREENGYVKERADHAKVNQKLNGVHDDHCVQKGDSYMTLSGHRAGEAAIAYEHGADIEALMPKLRRTDYYTEPRIQELAAKERAEQGFCCCVKDFVVGRVGYGSIKFFGETDVRCLDLEALVQFNNREVIVYMDDSKKPPVGHGLNKPAEVTLLNITCTDKKTGHRFTEGPKTERYKQMLKKKAEDQGAEFVSYDALKGEWKFRVKHFSKYELGEEDNWDTDAAAPAQDC
ncbi:nuclear pore complex protein NUP98A-like [Pyrus x bretschneideri]|uniref:nuclear pore complex protein NUP98A-like n=1 Tax=Pyrus x bretschneideri TaxID=225117 RepID=UPI00202EEB8E|nr:nuclear pore complex protein NUP98A-like [Pyrus x bretschneideri]